MDVLRLVRYNHFLWRRFADFFVESCSWEELTRNHESSHHSIANVSMHAVNMEDWWLHYVVPGKEWAGPRYDGFTSASAMRTRVHEVEDRTTRLLAETTPRDLVRPRSVDVGGERSETTLEDVLAETVSEATHHRGEVLAMLWRMDKEPPYVSFLEWARDEEGRGKR